MVKELYVVAFDASLEQLKRYSKYFESDAMKVLGINPTFVTPIHTIKGLTDALENPQRPGLLIIDGNPDSGVTLNEAVSANTAIGVHPLEMIILSDDPEVIGEAKARSLKAAPKSDYLVVLKNILHDYGRGKGRCINLKNPAAQYAS
ncbi:MAG: hypothetical protein V1702_01130 [Candidatus Woesearchaeota archaeon]